MTAAAAFTTEETGLSLLHSSVVYLTLNRCEHSRAAQRTVAIDVGERENDSFQTYLAFLWHTEYKNLDSGLFSSFA